MQAIVSWLRPLNSKLQKASQPGIPTSSRCLFNLGLLGLLRRRREIHDEPGGLGAPRTLFTWSMRDRCMTEHGGLR